MKVDVEPTGEPKEGYDALIYAGICPWPYVDESADEIHCAHYIQRAPDLISFFNELYRTLKPKGTALVIAPYYSSMNAWQDPRTLRAISEATFITFNKKWRTDNKRENHQIAADFDFTYGYSLDPAWANRSQEAQAFAVKHYQNVAMEIHVTLTKRE